MCGIAGRIVGGISPYHMIARSPRDQGQEPVKIGPSFKFKRILAMQLASGRFFFAASPLPSGSTLQTAPLSRRGQSPDEFVVLSRLRIPIPGILKART